MNIKKTQNNSNLNRVRRYKNSKDSSFIRMVEQKSNTLSYRDLLYLSRSLDTGDSRYIRRMSNSAKKVYSFIKLNLNEDVSRYPQKATHRNRKQTRLPIKLAVKVINSNIQKKEKDMTKGIDVTKVYSKLDTEEEI